MLKFYAKPWPEESEDVPPKVEKYPLDDLPRLIREAVECGSVRMQHSPPMYAAVAVAAAALAVQGVAAVKLPNGSIFPLSLYSWINGKSGIGKSPAYDMYFDPFVTKNKEADETFKKATKEYQSRLRSWKAQTRYLDRVIARKRANGEVYSQQQDALDKLNDEEPEAPRLQSWLVSDPTGAAFLQRLRGRHQSIGLTGDEGAKVIKHLHEYLADLCQAWNHGDIDSHRVSSGSTSVYDARIMALISIQPKEFAQLSAGQGKRAAGMGMWARFLFTLVRKPKLPIWSEDKLDATTVPIDKFLARIGELIALRVSRINSEVTEQDLIELDADAEECWKELVEEMRKRSDETGDLADVDEFAAKAPMHAVRLAAIFAYFCGEAKITRDTMQRAISIIRYHIDAYCELFSLAKSVPIVVKHAGQLENYFRRLNLQRGWWSVEVDFLHHSNTSAELKVDKNLQPALRYMESIRKIEMSGPPRQRRVNFRPLLL